jgi:ABC-2 type transport system ATP-binding protein
VVTSLSSDLGEKILHTLPKHGFRIRALARTEPNLEDVFLAATRRSWDARLPDKKSGANGDRPPLPKV